MEMESKATNLFVEKPLWAYANVRYKLKDPVLELVIITEFPDGRFQSFFVAGKLIEEIKKFEVCREFETNFNH